MELSNIKEIAPSESGYPVKDYALKARHMSSNEYHHTKDIDMNFLHDIAEMHDAFVQTK